MIFISNFCLQVWVEWFGERTVSLVSRSNVKSLAEGVSRRIKQKPLSTDLKRAIQNAMKDAAKQVSFYGSFLLFVKKNFFPFHLETEMQENQ